MGSGGALVQATAGLLGLTMILVVFPYLGFRKAWWWGLTCLLFAGVGTIVFSANYFRETWKYLAITVALGSLSLGIFILRSFVATFFTEVPVQ